MGEYFRLRCHCKDKRDEQAVGLIRSLMSQKKEFDEERTSLGLPISPCSQFLM